MRIAAQPLRQLNALTGPLERAGEIPSPDSGKEIVVGRHAETKNTRNHEHPKASRSMDIHEYGRRHSRVFLHKALADSGCGLTPCARFTKRSR